MVLIPENLFQCPKTGEELVLNESGSSLHTRNSDITYPIVDGIIDFIPHQKEEQVDSYEDAAKFYDNLLNSTNPVSRVYNQIVWGFVDEDYVGQVLDHIPDNFKGVLLDIPTGTGVFTAEKYSRLKNAVILATDYSTNMLRKNKQIYNSLGIKNVVHIRADIGNIPIKNEEVDKVLTMNGFHAFPRKRDALMELHRVLKTDGSCTGCFYIKGKRRFTDFVVDKFYSKMGWFQQPFFTEEETIGLIGEHFRFQENTNCKSIFQFNSLKPAV